MKILLFLGFTLFINQVVFAQLPTGPGGKTLYQKGDCKTILPNVKYKCVFCEDEALTKNCKEYDCSLTECTESKPTKEGDGRTLSKPINIDAKQLKIKDDIDTTSKLPEGTKLENGNVVVTNGYKAVLSADKKIVFILNNNGGNVAGTYSCGCYNPEVYCYVSYDMTKIYCNGHACCVMVVGFANSQNLTMEAIEKKPELIKWKKLTLPTKSN